MREPKQEHNEHQIHNSKQIDDELNHSICEQEEDDDGETKHKNEGKGQFEERENDDEEPTQHQQLQPIYPPDNEEGETEEQGAEEELGKSLENAKEEEEREDEEGAADEELGKSAEKERGDEVQTEQLALLKDEEVRLESEATFNPCSPFPPHEDIKERQKEEQGAEEELENSIQNGNGNDERENDQAATDETLGRAQEKEMENEEQGEEKAHEEAGPIPPPGWESRHPYNPLPSPPPPGNEERETEEQGAEEELGKSLENEKKEKEREGEQGAADQELGKSAEKEREDEELTEPPALREDEEVQPHGCESGATLNPCSPTPSPHEDIKEREKLELRLKAELENSIENEERENDQGAADEALGRSEEKVVEDEEQREEKAQEVVEDGPPPGWESRPSINSHPLSLSPPDNKIREGEERAEDELTKSAENGNRSEEGEHELIAADLEGVKSAEVRENKEQGEELGQGDEDGPPSGWEFRPPIIPRPQTLPPLDIKEKRKEGQGAEEEEELGNSIEDRKVNEEREKDQGVADEAFDRSEEDERKNEEQREEQTQQEAEDGPPPGWESGPPINPCPPSPFPPDNKNREEDERAKDELRKSAENGNRCEETENEQSFADEELVKSAEVRDSKEQEQEQAQEEGEDGPPPGWESRSQIIPHPPTLPLSDNEETEAEKQELVKLTERRDRNKERDNEHEAADGELRKSAENKRGNEELGEPQARQEDEDGPPPGWEYRPPIKSCPPTPSPPERDQMVCGSCRRLLSYPPGSKYVQCSCCQVLNYVLEEHQIGQVKCGSCAVLLMYPYGAPSVRCSSCRSVTNIGDHNKRPPLSVQQSQACRPFSIPR